MVDFVEDASGLGIPHLGSGFNDIVAFVFDSPRETSTDATAADVLAKNILEAQSFRLTLDQKSATQEKLIGENAETTNLSIGQISINGSLQTLLMQPVSGWVTPLINTLWDRTRFSHYGTATAAVGNLISNVGVGSTTIITDNVSDFASLPTPFSLRILTDSETPETISVVNVHKASRTLMMNSAVSYAHTINASTLSCLPYNIAQAPAREPAFSLLSLREGLLSPCLIDKLTITADAHEPIKINIDFKALRIFRDRQVDLYASKESLKSQIFKIHDPTRVVNGTNVKIYLSNSATGSFGLAAALGDPILSGFQGLQIPEFTVTGVTLTINNQLKEVYTAHSISRDLQIRRRENTYPYALVSEGRVITGTIRYRSPIDFWSNLEKIAGPSSLNGGGLTIDFGNFKIVMDEIAYQPSTGDGDMQTQNREISFTMLSETKNGMPLLLFSDQV
jgi:hypothetical protein